MKKDFSKKDLQTGDFIVLRCGLSGVVLLEKEIILYQDGMDDLDAFSDNLESEYEGFECDIVEVYRSSGPMCFNDYDEADLVYERIDEIGRPGMETYEAAVAKEREEEELRKQKWAEEQELKQKNLIRIIVQAFYGNRTATEIEPEDIDYLIQGIVDKKVAVPDGKGGREKVDRSIIHIPGTENLVLVYNKYQEEERLKEKEERFKEDGYVIKPLASIPELDIELYSRCLMCRMNKNGEFESIQNEDAEYIRKYLAI